ncbi:2'-5' RNA ligase family protein [Streptomyces indicus]|uniref:2'-5' RNA ligase n=1 Tax=Streptomyces indicus TaxID=417292 RepID=A0A1G8U216_9ACTN|nr:2'-5' RNA ligase family protein [Streptomyces indicus]SDJ47674.1 2'-5' RNA ligase [Streptomyces indicus]
MSSGWGHALGETALTILVPEADPLMREDFPAHVSVLFPFLHEGHVDDSVRRRLGELVRGHEPFELTFAEFGRYPGVLYLEPWPADPLRALTKSVVAAWPECAPYGGIFGEAGLAPHLTLANSAGPDTADAAYDALERELAPRLPLTVTVREVTLVTWDGQAWRSTRSFPLGTDGTR